MNNFESLRNSRRNFYENDYSKEEKGKFIVKDRLLSENNIDFSDLLSIRELNSIYRCDIVLCNSDYEQFILWKKYNIKNTLLISNFYALNYEPSDFLERKNFVFIGIYFTFGKFNFLKEILIK